MEQKIPYKIYLAENEIPTQWYNVRADMKVKPAPLIHPGDGHPLTLEEMNPIFCEELNKQELDNDTAYFDIPKPVQEFYRMYRPSPLVRAYFLEKALGTPAKIYYKFEGNNTSGSHKLNSSIAQAYYAKAQGLKGVTTETGAGQWGTALSMACSYFDLDCKVFMVKVSYEQKPFRREVMRTYGANVTPSPSMTTEVGRKILANHPGTTGSLGCAISEAVETAVKTPGSRIFPYLQKNLDEIVTIPDEELVTAFLDMVENHKMIVENSGLLSVAALRHIDCADKKVVSVLSGGNMDVITMSSVVQQGLILRDRIFTVSVLLPDKPGELHRVSGVIAAANGNVIKLEHNQFVSINRNAAVELRITLEAFGTEHKNEIISVLQKNGFKPRFVRTRS